MDGMLLTIPSVTNILHAGRILTNNGNFHWQANMANIWISFSLLNIATITACFSLQKIDYEWINFFQAFFSSSFDIKVCISLFYYLDIRGKFVGAA